MNAPADRERAIQWCLAEVLRWHSDPASPDYNECDKEPCHWCAVARELVTTNDKLRHGGEKQ
jgi:hypothetical protein